MKVYRPLQIFQIKKRLHSAFLLTLGLFSYRAANAEIFVGYDQFCGLPVLVEKTPQTAVASRDANGNPIIYIDPGALNNWTHSRLFTLAHECGHHRLGHVTPSGLWFRNYTKWATRVQELQADCWASIALRKIWQFSDINRVIIQYQSEGNTNVGNYPSGQERAANIAKCAAGTYQSQQSKSLTPNSPESIAIGDPQKTSFGYVPPEWVNDVKANKVENKAPKSSQPSRFGRYLEIIKSEIPRLFAIDSKNQKFEEKGICVARFEFTKKNDSSFFADLDFRDDIVFKTDAPYSSSIWVEVAHWEVSTPGKPGREINMRSKLSQLNRDGSMEDLISFQMLNYVKQEHADKAKEVMRELIDICHGPSM